MEAHNSSIGKFGECEHKEKPPVAGETLRQLAERIIEGIPKSYRDGDEESGRERTVKWLTDVLREHGWACRPTPGSSRMCELGTKTCEVQHDQAGADTKRLDWLMSRCGYYVRRETIDAAMKEK